MRDRESEISSKVGLLHIFFRTRYWESMTISGDIHSATNKFRDWPWKTSLKQNIRIFIDFLIRHILLQFQYTCFITVAAVVLPSTVLPRDETFSVTATLQCCWCAWKQCWIVLSIVIAVMGSVKAANVSHSFYHCETRVWCSWKHSVYSIASILKLSLPFTRFSSHL